jgi:hypothetical protein
LDKVEKVLRGKAEQSCIRLILCNLDAEDRGPIHPAKGLEVTPVIEIATFSRTPISPAFATAASTIFCASSEEMLCFFTTLVVVMAQDYMLLTASASARELGLLVPPSDATKRTPLKIKCSSWPAKATAVSLLIAIKVMVQP